MAATKYSKLQIPLKDYYSVENVSILLSRIVALV